MIAKSYVKVYGHTPIESTFSFLEKCEKVVAWRCGYDGVNYFLTVHQINKADLTEEITHIAKNVDELVEFVLAYSESKGNKIEAKQYDEESPTDFL